MGHRYNWPSLERIRCAGDARRRARSFFVVDWERCQRLCCMHAGQGVGFFAEEILKTRAGGGVPIVGKPISRPQHNYQTSAYLGICTLHEDHVEISPKTHRSVGH